MKNKIFLIVLILVVAFVLWYVMLPPLNLSSPLFWTYAFLMYIFIICILIPNTIYNSIRKRYVNWNIPKNMGISVGVAIGTIALLFVINFLASPIFSAKTYARRITVDDTSTFTDDVAMADFSKMPLLDKDSSQKLGDRKMGQASEWVSQFYVSELYTQINYNDSIIRVTPIEYAGFIKYLTNRRDGIKGYITVNSVDGESKLITFDKGIKYTKSAYFFENLSRKLRVSYPTEIFDEPSFEIDNAGHPYWIVPTVKYRAIGLKKEIKGVILLDAVTGKSKKYKISDVPSWVDHVYSADLIIEQLNDWGEYGGGFINSIFGQKNVVNTTEGYNYLVMADDVYLYTGITSVSTDESNIGFVLVNMRTKETKFYSVPGAEEYSAMASAEGLVQEKGYTASFPLLINLNNKPTYLLSLKDAAGLVKMYSFVDVEDYQKVIVNESSYGIEAAVKKYLGEVDLEVDNNNLKKKTIRIKEITSAVIDGTTFYYIVDENGLFYQASIKIDKETLPFIKKGDALSINYKEGNVNVITLIEDDNE